MKHDEYDSDQSLLKTLVEVTGRGGETRKMPKRGICHFYIWPDAGLLTSVTTKSFNNRPEFMQSDPEVRQSYDKIQDANKSAKR